jgi:hypothetical protein
MNKYSLARPCSCSPWPKHLAIWLVLSLPLSAIASPDLEERIIDNNAAIEQAQIAQEKSHSLPDPKLTINVAVYPLVADGVPEGMATIVSEQVLSEIRKLKGISAIGMEEIMEMLSLEAQKQSAGCGSDESCIAQIAGALGVDELITGRITETATGRFLMVRRIDQRRARTLKVFQQNLELADGTEFLAAIKPAIKTVYPQRDVRPGEKRGVASEIALSLNPPPLPTWSTLTMFGVSTAAVVTGGLMSYLAFDVNQDFLDSANYWEGSPGSYPTALEERGELYNQLATAAFITGGVTLVSGVVMSFFTDWMGYGDAEPN